MHPLLQCGSSSGHCNGHIFTGNLGASGFTFNWYSQTKRNTETLTQPPRLLLGAFPKPVTFTTHQINDHFQEANSTISSGSCFHPRNSKQGDPVQPSPTTDGLVDTKCHKDDGHQQDAENGPHQHCKGKTGYLVKAPGSMTSLRDSAFPIAT